MTRIILELHEVFGFRFWSYMERNLNQQAGASSRDTLQLKAMVIRIELFQSLARIP